MPRAKVTYRDGRGLNIHSSLTASPRLLPDEAELPTSLQRTLLEIRLQLVDQEARPSGQDVLNTLRRLSVASDDELQRAAPLLELYTQAALATAALRVGGGADLDPVMWSPGRLRQMAKEAATTHAHKSMFRGGRRRTAPVDAWLNQRAQELWQLAGKPSGAAHTLPRR